MRKHEALKASHFATIELSKSFLLKVRPCVGLFLKSKSWDYVNLDDSEIWACSAALPFKPSSSFFPSILAITNTHRVPHWSVRVSLPAEELPCQRAEWNFLLLRLFFFSRSHLLPDFLLIGSTRFKYICVAWKPLRNFTKSCLEQEDVITVVVVCQIHLLYVLGLMPCHSLSWPSSCGLPQSWHSYLVSICTHSQPWFKITDFFLRLFLVTIVSSLGFQMPTPYHKTS